MVVISGYRKVIQTVVVMTSGAGPVVRVRVRAVRPSRLGTVMIEVSVALPIMPTEPPASGGTMTPIVRGRTILPTARGLSRLRVVEVLNRFPGTVLTFVWKTLVAQVVDISASVVTVEMKGDRWILIKGRVQQMTTSSISSGTEWKTLTQICVSSCKGVVVHSWTTVSVSLRTSFVMTSVAFSRSATYRFRTSTGRSWCTILVPRKALKRLTGAFRSRLVGWVWGSFWDLCFGLA